MHHYYKTATAVALLALILVLPFDVLGPLAQKEKPPEIKRILIVPGHEPTDGGAVYKDLKERKIVTDIARRVAWSLDNLENVEVMVARDDKSWAPALQEYFDANRSEIISWTESHKMLTIAAIDSGELEEVESVQHNNAPAETALHLYGINKWVQEDGNDFDLIIHLHINDDNRKNRKVPGKYSGFSIYVPESQYVNAQASRKLGEILKEKLSEAYKPSTLDAEKDTVIESQELIAMGRYRTLDATPVALVEYGYIYEDIFSAAKKEENIKTMSEKTVEAISTFLSL